MADQAITAGTPTLPAVGPRVREQRWALLRRALSARMGPFGGVGLILAVLMALLAPLIAPYDPLKQDLGNVLLTPSAAHLLGTDNLGRDVLARVIWGTRVSLIAGFASVAVAVVVGSLLGLLAGFT